MDSSSGFIVPADFSSEWRDISLLQKRARTLVYVGSRYDRRFVLKAIAPEYADLTDYRLQQEQEFQLGIQLVHPNIAATYSIEEIEGVGRCIVQEWIDGVTLGEWLQTKPSKGAQERVFDQLLDALEYIHGLQLVHHDLKADNILITRNGSNVKLIDFGLSALDATLSPVDNDPQTDIQALKKLFPAYIPQGQFSNIASLRRTIQRRKKVIRMFPDILLFLLLVLAGVLLYVSWSERKTLQSEYNVDVDEIRAVIDSIYQPVYDSLLLPDARYHEIASMYFTLLPQPMKEYNRLIARYKVGSVAYATFSETWNSVSNQKYSDLNDRIKSLPNYTIEYNQGHLSREEYLRLIEIHRGIYRRHNSANQ